MARLSYTARSWTSILLSSLVLISTFSGLASAAGPPNDGKTYIQGTDKDGITRLLANDRYPALYTGQFGDCLGGQSLINVTHFDAAYYADNMTVLFHLSGATNIKDESVMMYISVDAYGEDRFDLIFNPCNANIKSLCPMNASSPIKAEAIIPVGPSDVGGIPDIALVIPDFEGYATLRFYANSSQTEIGCFQAVMRNGASLSHPEAVAPALGLFTLVAILASFFTATYGVSMTAIRTHYAHSLSVLVIFETFQSFFFSGALSVRWPSVCSAWWSNFAWASGIIYSPALMTSINSFVGNNGNSSQVGGAGSVTLNNKGGLKQIYGRGLTDVSQIYSRSTNMMSDKIFNGIMKGSKLVTRQTATDTSPEAAAASASAAAALGPGYDWYGGPVFNGLPNPGNWDNFTGTLSTEAIPATDAFLTSLIWFLVAMGATVVMTVGFKGLLEAMSKIRLIKADRLSMFRSHWLGYLGQIMLRILLMGFFVMMTLTLYQFSIHGQAGVNAGVIAVAAVVFIIFSLGMFGAAAYACFYRTKIGKYETLPDRILLTHSRVVWKCLPAISLSRKSVVDTWREKDQMRRMSKHMGSLPFFRIKYTYTVPTNASSPEYTSIHADLPYIKRFGWLSARYRGTKWYFFIIYLVYQFLRACFVGGASKNPQAQVYGLFALEIIAFIVVASLNPFEGSRNTALAVYLLSISKVITAGMSIALLPEMKLARIPATVVGFVIVITQALCCIALLILIVLSAISSWMSLSRNREDFHPSAWSGLRIKYFEHLSERQLDKPKERPETPKAEEPVEPYFEVKTVYRAPKIEDEDEDLAHPAIAEDSPGGSELNVQKLRNTPTPTQHAGRSRGNTRASRSGSFGTPLGTGNLPFGARPHRQSWSSRDFSGSGWKSSTDEFTEYNTHDGTLIRREILGQHPEARDWQMHPGTNPAPAPTTNYSRHTPSPTMANYSRPATSGDRSRSQSRNRSRVVTPTEETRRAHAGERFGISPAEMRS